MEKLKAFYLFLLFSFMTACAQERDYPAPPPYSAHPSGEMPIVASYGFYHPYMTDQQAVWVKEAGFNTLQKALNETDTDSLLRLANKHGLKVIVSPYGFRDTLKTADFIARFKDAPAAWGFTVQDEPTPPDYPNLAKVMGIMNDKAPEQNGFINLLPAMDSKKLKAKDYRAYVEEYVQTVNPPYISYDIYPVKQKKDGTIYVDPNLYPTLEVISDVAKNSGRPFRSYILSNKHLMYPEPTEDFIRFSVFMALAYGAQGLNYYTYCMPDFDKVTGDYSLAPIDWDGNRTKVWYMVRDVNREVRNLQHVFLGAEVLDVTQTGVEIPAQTKRLSKLPEPFRIIDSDGIGVTVSHLKNGGDEFLLLVNRDVQKKQKVFLSRTRPVERLYGDGKVKRENGSSLTLSPGGYALYKLPEMP